MCKGDDSIDLCCLLIVFCFEGRIGKGGFPHSTSPFFDWFCLNYEESFQDTSLKKELEENYLTMGLDNGGVGMQTVPEAWGTLLSKIRSAIGEQNII